MNGKPLIGITPLWDREKNNIWMLPGYIKGIEAAGGIPVILPLTEDEEALEKMVQTLDGFLLTGGQDVNPLLYDSETLAVCGECCIERDALEKKLIELVVKYDKPMLGICRGAQMINVFFGGTLYQDIPAQTDSKLAHRQKMPYSNCVHTLRIKTDTLLYKILGKTKIRVNSLHHQAVKDLAGPLKAAAAAPDGIIEAVEYDKAKFLLAVQWHPEYNFQTDENSLALFRYFVNCCN